MIRWADENNRQWAFSLSNAGSYYVQFRATAESLSELNWEAIGATDFRRPEIKESKQAEFLLFGSFPFELVERIGCIRPWFVVARHAMLSPADIAPHSR